MDEITLAPTVDEVTGQMADDFVDLLSLAEQHKDSTSTSELAMVCRGLLDLNEAGFFAPIHEAIAKAEERYAYTMAGLRGIDLNDRYPKGDENGIIRPR